MQQNRIEGYRKDDMILLEVDIEYTFFCFFLRKEIMFLEENT
jgi:hypothetical protein